MALIGGYYDWPIRRGDDETMVVVLPDTIDPTGRTYSCQLRAVPDYVTDPEDERLLATAAVTVAGQDVAVVFTHDQTESLRPLQRVWYSVRETIDATGYTTTLLAGRVVVRTAATEQAV